MASSAQQVQELATQMQTLALEKERLEAQNRVLQHTVKLSSRHIQDTNAEKVDVIPSLLRLESFQCSKAKSLLIS